MGYKDHKILIIGKVWPEPNSSAAGTRMLQFIDLFKALNWKIIFATSASESPFAIDLSKIGVKTAGIKLNDSSFDIFMRETDPDIVLYDRFMTEEQYGWRVREQCPNAMTILDTEDLHCLREARQRAWKDSRAFSTDDLFSDLAKREIASILRCDLSIIISEYEMHLLKQNFGIDMGKLIWIPFMLESISEVTINNWRPFGKRQHFISIGNFLHEPNWNAVQFMKEDIWPIIRAKLPDTELHIYGAYPSQKVEQLHNEREGFLVKGRSGNAKEVVGKAKVLLAPLRFGAGLKGKLIEAMQCGTPSVTTHIGAESMHGNQPWAGSIGDDPELFSKAAVELYTDPDKWSLAQQAGIKIINTIYDKRLHAERFTNRVHAIYNDLLSHRRQYFTGEILHHHLHGSTRYMSKWIEAKNKN